MEKSVELTKELLFTIIERLDSSRDALLFRILFETGCSASELCMLRAKDYHEPKLHYDMHVLYFGERITVISAELGRLLKHFIDKQECSAQEYIFSKNKTRPFSVKRLEQIIAQKGAKYIQSLTPIDLRYLHIKYAASLGLTIDSISMQTGLSRQRIIQIYEKLNITQIQSYSRFFEGGTL